MELPADLKYATTHEWARIEGDLATIGITDFAQNELGDVVYLELPEVGRTLHQGDIFGSVKSVKAVSDLYSPVSGEVVEVNDELVGSPEEINQDPYGHGWMIIVRMEDASDADSLLTAKQYAQANGG